MGTATKPDVHSGQISDVHQATNQAHAVELHRAAAQGERQEEKRDEPYLSHEQVELLKRTICRGSTDDELALFMNVCTRLRLDPFTKQIHAVKRYDRKEGRDVMAIQVGIDGFRLVAERTDKYLGQLGPQWCGDDGVWREVWLHSSPPKAARVAALKQGFVEPLWAVAHWSEYVQTRRDGGVTEFWQRMPALMLAKVAEALALRKAFPNELSGVYTPEEMAQADREDGGRSTSSATSTTAAATQAEEIAWTVESAKAHKLHGRPGAFKGRAGKLLGAMKQRELESIVGYVREKVDEERKEGRQPRAEWLRTLSAGEFLLAHYKEEAEKNQTQLPLDEAEANGQTSATSADQTTSSATAASDAIPGAVPPPGKVEDALDKKQPTAATEDDSVHAAHQRIIELLKSEHVKPEEREAIDAQRKKRLTNYRALLDLEKELRALIDKRLPF